MLFNWIFILASRNKLPGCWAPLWGYLQEILVCSLLAETNVILYSQNHSTEIRSEISSFIQFRITVQHVFQAYKCCPWPSKSVFRPYSVRSVGFFFQQTSKT